MERHTWTDSEMIETIEIASLHQAHWSAAIAKLTARIRRTDPCMDALRVRTAVNAACNALSGNPDAFPRASQRLRLLVAQRHRVVTA